MTILESWSALSARERRVISWAIGCVVAGVLFGRGLPALNDWTTRERTRRETLMDSLSTLHALSTWQRRLAARRVDVSSIAVPSLLILDSALNRPAAEAKLMSLVSDAGDESGLDLTSLQIVAEPTTQRHSRIGIPADASQRVSVRTSGTGDIDALTSFLSFVDTSHVPVVVRSITVSPRQPSALPDGASILTIDLVISGLLRIPDSTMPERVR